MAVTNESLANSYLQKASDRLDVLEVLLKKEDHTQIMVRALEGAVSLLVILRHTIPSSGFICSDEERGRG